MKLPISFVLLVLAAAAAPAAAAPAACVNGQAGGFECQRVDLVAHLDTAALGLGNLNDVWGWTDPVTDTEYALVGAVGGTAFVDLSDPENPVLVGRLPAHDELSPVLPACAAKTSVAGPRPLHDDSQDQDGGCGGGSAWRNIKTYADHAYIGSEAAGHGLQVFDLRQLRDVAPGDMPVEFQETAHYGQFGNSHTLIVNEQTGFLYAVGSNTFNGGPHFVDLAVPGSPQFAGGWGDDFYTHEALCITYDGPDVRYTARELCLLSNEDTLTVLDVTDKGAPQQISRTTYPMASYTHQGWLTADQRYLLVNDELDERNFNLRTTTLVWDLNDLQAPQLVRRYEHPTWVIDHNNYVHDGFVYQSNYTAGLVVLDGRDPLNLFEVGYFDTHPADDLRIFDGTWSNYPFFASGVVAVSDISGGLFLLRPRLPDPGIATDIQATLAESATPPTAGHRRVVWQVTNAGADPAPDVMGMLSVNAFFDVVSITPLPGSAPVTCVIRVDPVMAGSSTPHCRAPSLAPGQSFVVEIDVTFGTTLAVRAWSTSGATETAPANNLARLDINVPVTGGGGGGPFDGLLALLLPCLLARRRRQA